MTIASGQGCSTPRPISSSSSTARSDTRPRWGFRNDSIHGRSRCLFTSAGPPVGASRVRRSQTTGAETARTEAQQRYGNVQRHDLMVARVGDVQPSRARGECDARGRTELDASLVAHVAHDAVEIDSPDRAVVVVGDENREAAEGILDERQAGRPRQTRVYSGSVVPR